MGGVIRRRKLMDLYHVVVEIHGEKKPLFLFGDLSKSDLRKRFLNPYYLGKPVLKKNQVVDLSRVRNGLYWFRARVC